MHGSSEERGSRLIGKKEGNRELRQLTSTMATQEVTNYWGKSWVFAGEDRLLVLS